MRFLLDESSLNFRDFESDAIERIMTEALNEIDQCRSENQVVAKFSEIYTQSIDGEHQFYNLLFEDSSPVTLDRDLKRRMQIAIDRCVNWDEFNEISETDVEIEGERNFAPTLAFVHGQISNRQAVSCIPFNNEKRTGNVPVVVNGEVIIITFTTSQRDRLVFYRSIFEIEDIAEQSFFEVAQLAFPKLQFVYGLDRQFRRFSKRYATIRTEVVRHLSALNDHGDEAFDGFPEPYVIQQRMNSLANVDMSLESSQTRSNSHAWGMRRIEHDGMVIYCDWHTKISPTADRIHFHPPRSDSGLGIVIGIFAEHLET